MISVITPTNNTRYLKETYDSLAGQTHEDWEWVVVPNGGATWEVNDPRVRVVPADFTGSIGGLKRFACRATFSSSLTTMTCSRPQPSLR